MSKVLIADDALFIRIALKRLLESNGFDIVGEAENGQIAVEKYKELNPDIVTMDITMPIKSGIEALKEIMDFDKNAKIVMITAMGQEGMVKQAILDGARSFIVKPYQDEHVLNVLNKLV